jgi:transposase InsO family protein
MNVHKNARLTPAGRALLASRVEAGWSVKRAAEAAGVSERTAYKWLSRHRLGGERRHHDRSSAPSRCPRRTPPQRVIEIERLRRERLTGARIAQALGMARSTVGAVLRRLGLGRLSALQPREPENRYERARPGELIHIDIKSLGRIDGVGHRITGKRSGQTRNRGIGWDHLHVAVDDASRLAYVEMLPSLGQHDASAFLQRAIAWYGRLGVKVERVMTDNGSAYVSKLFARTMQDAGVRHIRTRPFRPQTNGKAERFIQTSLREWAYAKTFQSSAERAADVGPWADAYNLARPHAGIGHLSPWQRLNNLLGNDI